MKNLNSKEKQIIILIGIVFIVFISTVLKENFISENKIDNSVSNEVDLNIVKYDEEGEASKEKIEEKIYVHISGRVKNPGLIILDSNSRVVDAIDKAGGLCDDADADKINLAKKVTDEEKIYIPLIGEVEDINYSKEEGESDKINLNTADEGELCTLPGIGPKTAEKILKYRENYKFEEIEDIMNVSGIGEKKFDALKDYISVR
ncbi:helix-hairpin-helix domain-containing protein [Anaerosphaera multitolerans]|uniref:Competence protein n=1 Tax=Anaerosphaera multitolerans TaxID=2487351 RepID=A0A437S7C1_9FIRM|nr:helix-hairpin-helix domain-containing protein [Anaerosphaera multitolerans]RVU54884.1 competence protein [Anaerosphaera multitolerans]